MGDPLPATGVSGGIARAGSRFTPWTTTAWSRSTWTGWASRSTRSVASTTAVSPIRSWPFPRWTSWWTTWSSTRGRPGRCMGPVGGTRTAGGRGERSQEHLPAHRAGTGRLPGGAERAEGRRGVRRFHPAPSSRDDGGDAAAGRERWGEPSQLGSSGAGVPAVAPVLPAGAGGAAAGQEARDDAAVLGLGGGGRRSARGAAVEHRSGHGADLHGRGRYRAGRGRHHGAVRALDVADRRSFGRVRAACRDRAGVRPCRPGHADLPDGAAGARCGRRDAALRLRHAALASGEREQFPQPAGGLAEGRRGEGPAAAQPG